MDKIKWHPRFVPLKSVGLLVGSEHREGVKKLLLNMEDNRCTRLRGSYCEHAVVIFGEAGDLPWLPGGAYIGQDSNAPHLFIPTLLKPNIPVDLLDKAVGIKFGVGQFVVNPWLHQVYNLSKTLKLSKQSLEEFL